MQCSGNSSRNVTVSTTPTFSGTNDYTIVVLLVLSRAYTARHKQSVLARYCQTFLRLASCLVQAERGLCENQRKVHCQSSHNAQLMLSPTDSQISVLVSEGKKTRNHMGRTVFSTKGEFQCYVFTLIILGMVIRRVLVERTAVQSRQRRQDCHYRSMAATTDHHVHRYPSAETSYP